MFEVKVEINNEYALEGLLWGQGLSTFKAISKEGLDDELMEHLEMLFCECGEIPDIGTINDYLAYEFNEYKFIAEHVNLCDIDDIYTLKQYAYDLDYRDTYDVILDAVNNNKEEYLWNYILDNFSEYNLHDLFTELDGIDLDENIEEC